MHAFLTVRAAISIVLLCALLFSIAPVNAVGDTIFEDGFEHICPTYFEDADLDTYGDDATGAQYCEDPPADWVTMGGDCDDTDGSVNPGAADDPDLAFLDTNCDLIDGDLENSIFANSSTGSDGNDGLTPETAVFGVGRAYERAVEYSRDWILISAATSVVVDAFVEGKNLAGGYDAADNWSRSTGNNQTMTVLNTGALIDSWTTATTWQLVTVDAPSSADGPSIGMRILNTSNLLLENVTVMADIAGNGDNVLTSPPAPDGNPGSPGDDGVEDSEGFCELNPNPLGGAGAAPGCGAGAGGNGGWPGFAGSTGEGGGAGAPPGFGGGEGGIWGNPQGAGGNGQPGTPGVPGGDGVGGQAFGSIDLNGLYVPSDGFSGDSGDSGSGGGGGGGGGGGIADCDSWGGGGGGGGSGGCGGTAGTGGTGGMASIGIVLLDSSISIQNSTISTNSGGFGGHGGDGGAGGPGGEGGAGGAGEDDSGPGGSGGAGGDGGHGGHGGGGGGGPSVGIICVGTSALTNVGSTVTPGTGRPGGQSLGNPGAAGEQTAIKDC